jgi:hypothetical protein
VRWLVDLGRCVYIARNPCQASIANRRSFLVRSGGLPFFRSLIPTMFEKTKMISFYGYGTSDHTQPSQKVLTRLRRPLDRWERVDANIDVLYRLLADSLGPRYQSPRNDGRALPGPQSSCLIGLTYLSPSRSGVLSAPGVIRHPGRGCSVEWLANGLGARALGR